MKVKVIHPSFVTQFPPVFEEGELYISEEFETAAHLCCCGCGEKVITPLNPAKWQIRKEGGSVSMTPSIGNWKFACQSHYWIRRNQVLDAGSFDAKKIEAVKRRDRSDMDRYIKEIAETSRDRAEPTNALQPSQTGFFVWLKKLFGFK